MRQALEFLEVDNTQMEDVLRKVEQAPDLDEKDKTLIRALFISYAYVADLVEDKNTTIRKLRQLFFGARTEKTRTVLERHDETSQAPSQPDTSTDAEPAPGEPVEPTATDIEQRCPGHGRNG